MVSGCLEVGEKDEKCGRHSLRGLCPAVSQGSVNPFVDPLLAGCRKKIAVAWHCKRYHELKMSLSYSSGLD